MTVWTLPEHREHHFWPGDVHDDCRWCRNEVLTPTTTPGRDHRDDGNPFAGLLFALLALCWVIAMWVTVAGVLDGAWVNGGTFWLAGTTFAIAYITRKA